MRRTFFPAACAVARGGGSGHRDALHVGEGPIGGHGQGPWGTPLWGGRVLESRSAGSIQPTGIQAPSANPAPRHEGGGCMAETVPVRISNRPRSPPWALRWQGFKKTQGRCVAQTPSRATPQTMGSRASHLFAPTFRKPSPQRPPSSLRASSRDPYPATRGPRAPSSAAVRRSKGGATPGVGTDVTAPPPGCGGGGRFLSDQPVRKKGRRHSHRRSGSGESWKNVQSPTSVPGSFGKLAAAKSAKTKIEPNFCGPQMRLRLLCSENQLRR